MDNINKIEAVTERDIDLLLLEEFNTSYEFSSWFYSIVTKDTKKPLCKGAWHSISDSTLGESDLIAIYENGLAILIENKIDALAQPEQGIRYEARGQKGVKTGLWSNFITCMVAPNLYMQKEKDAGVYQTNVSYEEIAYWFLTSTTNDRRSIYKSYIVKEAIEQNRRGYTINPDARVTEFWLRYWELSSQYYPDLEMKKPGIKPANSDWPVFCPLIFDKRFSIVHKLERGAVDLQIAGAATKLEFLQSLLSDSEISIEKAGKSAAVRLRVASIDRFASFESQKNIAIDGLNAARRLLDIGTNLKDKI
ncbi:PD-(D/E)XK nuclease family protein [Cellvibrio sp. UBA7661]|uniref:PD-(D/E)XK nuclease family protein n=1 Tax=Cellvibrio sp. UBA7661 TaxID=1946311 RepID=UPI002F35AD66